MSDIEYERENKQRVFLRYYQAVMLYFRDGYLFNLDRDGVPLIKLKYQNHTLKAAQRIMNQLRRSEYMDFCVYNCIYSLGNVDFILDAAQNAEFMVGTMRRMRAEVKSGIYTIKTDVDKILLNTDLRGRELFIGSDYNIPIICDFLVQGLISTYTFAILNKQTKLLHSLEKQRISNFVWDPVATVMQRYSDLLDVDPSFANVEFKRLVTSVS